MARYRTRWSSGAARGSPSSSSHPARPVPPELQPARELRDTVMSLHEDMARFDPQAGPRSTAGATAFRPSGWPRTPPSSPSPRARAAWMTPPRQPLSDQAQHLTGVLPNSPSASARPRLRALGCPGPRRPVARAREGAGRPGPRAAQAEVEAALKVGAPCDQGAHAAAPRAGQPHLRALQAGLSALAPARRLCAAGRGLAHLAPSILPCPGACAPASGRRCGLPGSPGCSGPRRRSIAKDTPEAETPGDVLARGPGGARAGRAWPAGAAATPPPQPLPATDQRPPEAHHRGPLHFEVRYDRLAGVGWMRVHAEPSVPSGGPRHSGSSPTARWRSGRWCPAPRRTVLCLPLLFLRTPSRTA